MDIFSLQELRIVLSHTLYDTSSAFLGETVHQALISKDDATKPVGDESLTSDGR